MLAARLTFPSTSAGAVHQKGRRPHHNYKCGARASSTSMKLCRYWMEDRCTRKSCPYAHPPKKQQKQNIKKQASATTCVRVVPLQNKTWRRPTTACAPDDDQYVGCSSSSPSHDKRAFPLNGKAYESSKDAENRPCKTHQDQHALVTNLDGHDAAVTGIALPFSSQTLFSVGKDATLRAWDCSSFLCSELLHLPHPASCLFNSFADPNWLFIGLPDEVRVCNLSTHTQQSLPVGSHVLSLSSSGNLLVAGLQEGAILVWIFEPSSAAFQPFTCLSKSENDHIMTSPVLSLEPSSTPSSNIIYAGSANGMIHVWDLASRRCLQALCAHNKGVTQLLSCDGTTLLSASQDGTIKLWKICATDQQLSLQDTYLPSGKSHMNGDDGSECPVPLAMCGVFDKANTPMLFAAYNDNQVYILEVPSFQCRGAIRTQSPIQAMDVGSCNKLFLGSSRGEISIWKWK